VSGGGRGGGVAGQGNAAGGGNVGTEEQHVDAGVARLTEENEDMGN
jgi:hypothetical protein